MKKTAYKKHWHVFVKKKIFPRKKFPIIDDKCHNLSTSQYFLMKFRHIVSKG